MEMSFFKKMIFTLGMALVHSCFSFCSFLFAMANPNHQGGKPQGPNLFIPILLSFAVVYFLIIRPQQRREKANQLQLQSVEKGDEVVTKGGLIGKVTNVAEKMLTLEISDKTRVKIDRNFIHLINKPKA